MAAVPVAGAGVAPDLPLKKHEYRTIRSRIKKFDYGKRLLELFDKSILKSKPSAKPAEIKKEEQLTTNVLNQSKIRTFDLAHSNPKNEANEKERLKINPKKNSLFSSKKKHHQKHHKKT